MQGQTEATVQEIQGTGKVTESQESCRDKTDILKDGASAWEFMVSSWEKIAARLIYLRSVSCFPILRRPSCFKPLVCQMGCGPWLTAPTNVTDSIHLQFHTVQNWSWPFNSKRVISSFLLLACVFPSSGRENAMLCPTCFKFNKIIKQFTVTGNRKYLEGDHNMIPSNIPNTFCIPWVLWELTQDPIDQKLIVSHTFGYAVYLLVLNSQSLEFLHLFLSWPTFHSVSMSLSAFCWFSCWWYPAEICSS